MRILRDADRVRLGIAPRSMSIDDFVGKVEPKKKKKLTAKKTQSFAIAVSELEAALVEDQSLAGAKPRVLVALFAKLYLHVYGVECTELQQANCYASAVNGSKRLIDGSFEGDSARAASFIRWAWRREQSREKSARAEGKVRQARMSWRWVFAAGFILDDYRLAQVRTNGATRAAS